MAQNHPFAFKKAERLCGRKSINNLFSKGDGFFSYPFKAKVLKCPATDTEDVKSVSCNNIQVLFSVPKSNFKRAVARNNIRRKAREAYRLNDFHTEFITCERLHIAFIFIAKKNEPYNIIRNGIKHILDEISKSYKPVF